MASLIESARTSSSTTGCGLCDLLDFAEIPDGARQGKGGGGEGGLGMSKSPSSLLQKLMY